MDLIHLGSQNRNIKAYIIDIMLLRIYDNRIRISSNCVELIFGKGHLSTLVYGGKKNQKTATLDAPKFER